MGLFSDLFTAAAEGVKAKADHAAHAAARKKAGKASGHDECTPCAANARVEAYRAAAVSSLPQKQRRRA